MRYAHECYLTDEADEALGALRAAASSYREVDDRVREGSTLGRLATILWCPGRGVEARRVGADAVELLEGLEPAIELARVYATMAFLTRMNADLDSAADQGSET